jgi:RNA polymerase sigma factor (sigma-70 family)
MKVDKNEFIKVVHENLGIINKICFAYTNNVEDRNDLKQEILIQLWKAYPQFKHRSKISTWMYRIALNTAISILRKVKRKILESELTESNYQIPEIEDDATLNENIIRLYRMIYRLSDLEKAIMLLYLDEQPYREIAEIVGISETNVATKISRIKFQFKNQFNKNN